MTLAEPDGATPLDPDELQGLRFDHVATRGELDELEQANIEQGLAWAERQRNADIFDDIFVRRLHEKLFGDVWAWAGQYRQTEKNIGIDPLQIPTQLRMLLDDARHWAATASTHPSKRRRGSTTGWCRSIRSRTATAAMRGSPSTSCSNGLTGVRRSNGRAGSTCRLTMRGAPPT